jgi:hypothetical protein
MEKTTPEEFIANVLPYTKGYNLVDGIYPKWATFVKPLIKPQGKKELEFHYTQTPARKEVERAFVILQAQFAIVRGLTRF